MRSLGFGLGFNRHKILGSVVPILDTYTGASAAYSLRNLSSNTTNVVRVRRSSNDDEQDFTASEVSDGTLTTFVGAGNDGFVTTWYDQSGNTNNQTQSSASIQPKIVDSGSLITKGGFPAITFDISDRLQGTEITPSYHYSFFGGFFDNLGTLNDLYSCGTGANERISVGMPTSGKMGFQSLFSNNNVSKGNSTNRITNNTKHLVTTRFENVASGDANIYVDSIDDSSGGGYTRGGAHFRLGSISGRFVCASFYELIVYNTDQSSNQSGIEGNITSHYSI